MLVWENILLALNGLKANKMRSLLTMLAGRTLTDRDQEEARKVALQSARMGLKKGQK